MSCGVGCRLCLDPELLWLWLVATALIGPLAWEPPYATGVAQEKAKRQKKKKKKKKLMIPSEHFFLMSDKLSNSFLILDQLSIFCVLLFPCREVSLRVPLISTFFFFFLANVTSFGMSSSSLSQLPSLFMLTRFSSPSSSDCRSGVS